VYVCMCVCDTHFEEDVYVCRCEQEDYHQTQSVLDSIGSQNECECVCVCVEVDGPGWRLLLLLWQEWARIISSSV